jgi:hypothetical protein
MDAELVDSELVRMPHFTQNYYIDAELVDCMLQAQHSCAYWRRIRWLFDAELVDLELVRMPHFPQDWYVASLMPLRTSTNSAELPQN